jgi:hypothetical protein
MSPNQAHEALSGVVADLRRETRVVLLELAEARHNGDTEGALALREELAELFEERDRKGHALDLLANMIGKGGK